MIVKPIVLKDINWRLIMLSVIVLALFITSQIISSGYILFPYIELSFISPAWKVPTEIMDVVKIDNYLWTHGPFNNPEVTQSYLDESFVKWFMFWLTASPLRMIIHSLIIISVILAIGTVVNVIRKQRRLGGTTGYLVFYISITIVWFVYAPQYRYLLPFFLPLVVLLISRFLNTHFILRAMNSAVWLLIVLVVIRLSGYFDVGGLTKNNALATMYPFKREYIVSPAPIWENKNFKSEDGINITSETYAWDCPVPCISERYTEYMYEKTGFTPKRMGESIREGFYSQK
jgi:hypothetical protein